MPLAQLRFDVPLPYFMLVSLIAFDNKNALSFLLPFRRLGLPVHSAASRFAKGQSKIIVHRHRIAVVNLAIVSLLRFAVDYNFCRACLNLHVLFRCVMSAWQVSDKHTVLRTCQSYLAHTVQHVMSLPNKM